MIDVNIVYDVDPKTYIKDNSFNEICENIFRDKNINVLNNDHLNLDIICFQICWILNLHFFFHLSWLQHE